ncbi:ORF6N domain-containing protein [Bdellovibrio sp. HCB117]|uniref:ORF6N domain-containing protein n=1 Tax=Bdellovibrio sp. HCB117 TaxID=3394359 RepID=UPI0039B5E31E
MKNKNDLVIPITVQAVRDNIYQIERNGILVQVVLDKDLADFYEMEVKKLNQQVSRSLDRGSKLFQNETFD